MIVFLELFNSRNRRLSELGLYYLKSKSSSSSRFRLKLVASEGSKILWEIQGTFSSDESLVNGLSSRLLMRIEKFLDNSEEIFQRVCKEFGGHCGTVDVLTQYHKLEKRLLIGYLTGQIEIPISYERRVTQ